VMVLNLTIPTLTIAGMEDLDYDNNSYINRWVNRYRDALANYFVSEDGQIPWQNEKKLNKSFHSL